MKDKILSLFTNPSEMTPEQIVLNIGIAAVLGFFIFISYYISHRGTIYSKKFNASLVILAALTGTVMTVIGNNIALSLGMVGALSIVRFRTAIKDPMDLLFLFWSIGTGIICGAGLYKIAVILAVLVTIGLLILDLFPVRISPYLLIINADSADREDDILALIQQNAGYYKLKSKNISSGRMDLIYETRSKNEKELVNSLSRLDGILSVSLLSHDGEVKQ